MMRKKFLYHILMLMFSTANLAAQQGVLSATKWSVAGTLPPGEGQTVSLGVAGPVTGVHQNGLVVAGGANFPGAMPWDGGQKVYYSEGFVFRKNATDSLQLVARFTLPFPLGYSANCSTPEGIVAAGGENAAGPRADVLLLHWNAGSQRVDIRELPPLPFAVTNAALAYHENKLYLAGGERSGDVSDEVLVLDMENLSAGWKNLAALPKPLSHAVLVVQSNGKGHGLFLLGGRKRNPGGLSELSASVYHFDLKNQSWTKKRSLPYAIAAGTGIAAGSHSILLFGGDTGETFHKTEALIAAISKEPDAAKKQQLNVEKSKVQSTHPGFCRQVLLYDAKKDKWLKGQYIPHAVPVTTTAVTWDSSVYLPSGEIKAGVRTPEILSAELKAF
ncbi:hypothetical protein HRH25_18615 [Flavisolibacter sp. BT320]|nr:hypothetical protein [Flavisolibacter longurius]